LLCGTGLLITCIELLAQLLDLLLLLFELLA
jgi:hypothetical protein